MKIKQTLTIELTPEDVKEIIARYLRVEEGYIEIQAENVELYCDLKSFAIPHFEKASVKLYAIE